MAGEDEERAMANEEAAPQNWSLQVEELLDHGDVDASISLLESVISTLEQTLNSSASSLQLACALNDLANLYQSRGFSIKADELQNRALVVKLRSQQENQSAQSGLGGLESGKNSDLEETRVSASDTSVSAEEDADWESLADHASNEVFSSHAAGILNISLKDTQLQVPKRRGRGAFLYKKDDLYSDKVLASTSDDDSDDRATSQHSKGPTEVRNSICGTSHVLVLSGFPPSTRTTELEQKFESFKDRGVAIRWVNDTTALAVFRTPSVAHEALNSTQYPFEVHTLDENDSLLTSLAAKDLEPPYPRPKTSTRTAQRLIAQGMGHRLPKVFGSNELKKQEEARKNRIHVRQSLRDDAWGPDDA